MANAKIVSVTLFVLWLTVSSSASEVGSAEKIPPLDKIIAKMEKAEASIRDVTFKLVMPLPVAGGKDKSEIKEYVTESGVQTALCPSE